MLDLYLHTFVAFLIELQLYNPGTKFVSLTARHNDYSSHDTGRPVTFQIGCSRINTWLLEILSIYNFLDLHIVLDAQHLKNQIMSRSEKTDDHYAFLLLTHSLAV